jgi:succinate dehydrogenase/fumarate reductase-like Fe-S protein
MGLKSFWLLGVQFVLHLLRRLFFLYHPGGAARFLENYLEDHIVPLEAGDREEMERWQHCTGCGLCEAACPTPIMTSKGLQTSFASLALTTWRDMSAYHLTADQAAALAECGECDACESVCPERIPLRDLAAFVVRTARRLS